MKTLLRVGLVCAAWCVVTAARADDVATLITNLKSTDSDVRRQAAKMLADLGADAKPAAPALIAALKNDKDLFVRRFSAQALGAIGPDVAKDAVPALGAATKDAVKDGKRELAEATLGALGKMGPSAVPALVDAFQSKSGDKPKKDKAAKKGEQVETEEMFVRRKAAQALGALGKDAKDAVPALTTALSDADVHTEAANALGDIGPAAKSALPALKEAANAKKGKDKAFKAAAKAAVKKIETTS